MIDPTLFDDADIVPASERCRYPSKFCRHRRSRKRNGELHRFCDHHRDKANSNQKRWSKSRRGIALGVSPRHGETDSDVSSFSEPPQSPLPTWGMETSSHEDEHEMNQLAGASPSFTSLLTMLQPQPFHPKIKREHSSDEQLSEFLRDLLVPLDEFPPMDAHHAAFDAVARMDTLEGFQIQL